MPLVQMNQVVSDACSSGSRFPGAIQRTLLVISCLWLTLATGRAQTAAVRWQDCLAQRAEWYVGAEASRIAENVLGHQRTSGGWPKNVDMAVVLGERENAELARQTNQNDATIDNGATSTQITYLARVFNATRQARFKAGAMKGIDYLLAAQYDNGGWPQFYPGPEGYQRHITFNDDAMINVMNLLAALADRRQPYGFVDEGRRRASETAVRKGVECILACQVSVNGRLTAWCAQHDEKTLQPAPARTYEKVSLSGMETVAIVRFLMLLKTPDSRVVAAVTSAVAWLDEVRLTGIRVEQRSNAELPGGRDRVVVRDPTAPPIWARFYEIGTNRPIFSGRDGVVRYGLAEIEVERRTGYQWYVSTPNKLLGEEYPAWRKRWAPTSGRLDQ